jgi:hypothetical protein
MTRQWCPLPAALSWVMWRAEWRTAVQWREQFLAFEKPDRALSRDNVEGFLAETCTPKQLMILLEELQQEGKLLRRDAHQLEELLLSHIGLWQ